MLPVFYFSDKKCSHYIIIPEKIFQKKCSHYISPPVRFVFALYRIPLYMSNRRDASSTREKIRKEIKICAFVEVLRICVCASSTHETKKSTSRSVFISAFQSLFIRSIISNQLKVTAPGRGLSPRENKKEV